MLPPRAPGETLNELNYFARLDSRPHETAISTISGVSITPHPRATRSRASDARHSARPRVQLLFILMSVCILLICCAHENRCLERLGWVWVDDAIVALTDPATPDVATPVARARTQEKPSRQPLFPIHELSHATVTPPPMSPMAPLDSSEASHKAR